MRSVGLFSFAEGALFLGDPRPRRRSYSVRLTPEVIELRRQERRLEVPWDSIVSLSILEWRRRGLLPGVEMACIFTWPGLEVTLFPSGDHPYRAYRVRPNDARPYAYTELGLAESVLMQMRGDPDARAGLLVGTRIDAFLDRLADIPRPPRLHLWRTKYVGDVVPSDVEPAVGVLADDR
ncbi:MAG: hypothetical protein LC722_07850 [Actinobacteria bacterium]|nr:hypothetical protein [Actinomycetota bacterium]